MAPIDLFAGLSKEFVQNFPPEFVSEKMSKEALDVEFHWVTEHGQDGHLTAGATVKATVSFMFLDVRCSLTVVARLQSVSSVRCRPYGRT